MTKRMWLIVLPAIIFVIGVQAANPAWVRGNLTESSLTDRSARLGNIQGFKAAFHEDEGKVRLVALVSPT